MNSKDEEGLSNFLPINRKLFRHALWLEERQYSKVEAWIDLLQSARFEASQGMKLIGNKVVKWNRGQFPVSLRFLATRWQWSTKKVTAFIDLLENEKMAVLETQKETGQSLITICKYDSYNLSDEKRKQQRKQEGNSMETPGKQEGNKTNIVNIGKKEEEGISPPEREFQKPTFADVKQYFATQNPGNANYVKNLTDATDFFDHYESNGWMVGNVPMANWQASIRKWSKNKKFDAAQPNQPDPSKKLVFNSNR